MVQGFVFQRKKRERGMCLKGIAGYANRVMEYQLKSALFPTFKRFQKHDSGKKTKGTSLNTQCFEHGPNNNKFAKICRIHNLEIHLWC